MNLTEKNILITGGSSGLGRALAIALAEEKANIIILSRTETALKESVAAVEAAGGIASYYCCDISDAKRVEKVFNEIRETHGDIHTLVNNAGLWFEGSTIDHDEKAVETLFKTNIQGMIYCTQQVIDTMRSKNEGQILNISSVAGLEPRGSWGVYSATKYAVRGFTDSLKDEFKNSKIKVMGFYPGGMTTNLFDSAGFNKKNEPWMMDVSDIADILIFMLTRPADVNMDHVVVRKVMQ